MAEETNGVSGTNGVNEAFVARCALSGLGRRQLEPGERLVYRYHVLGPSAEVRQALRLGNTVVSIDHAEIVRDEPADTTGDDTTGDEPADTTGDAVVEEAPDGGTSGAAV